MARHVGTYDHLNADDPVVTVISMDKLAEEIDRMNYGTHRLLCALIRVRRANRHERGDQQLTDGIAELLEKNYY